MTQVENEVENVEFLEPEQDAGPGLDLLGPSHVELPGGFGLPDGTVATEATVRELNGYDEEKLTRSTNKREIDFLANIVLLGVTKIGTTEMTPAVLDQLLLGDRDMLVLGIRKATFGDALEYDELVCPACNEAFDVRASIDEIPIKKLDDVSDRTFEVDLVHGSKALVRLATHGDQLASLAASTTKLADQNTALLARCVLRIGRVDVQADADEPETLVKRLNMRDRSKIITEMAKRQPGPDLRGVMIACPNCDREDSLLLDLITLFRI